MAERARDTILVDSSDEVDSAYGADSESELTSLRSSVMNYHYENGRRYHSYRAGSYWGPNDDKAMENMDLGHHVFTLLLGGKLYLSPISENPQRVLDVGTGSGTWAIEFADLHPSSTVIGTDLSPTQPKWIPPNVQFQVDDCCEEWLDHDNYDFVHVRCLYGSVADWDKFYKQALKSIKPGGYIEQFEISVEPISDDGTTKETIFEEWARVSLEAGDKFGKTLRIVNESKKRMIDAGFVDVVEHRFKMPLGPWPKDPNLKRVGLFNRLFFEECMQDWTMMLLTSVLGWSREEVEIYLMRARQGLHNPKIHPYQDVTVVVGRKPE